MGEDEAVKNYIIMDLEFNYPMTRYRSEENGIRLNQEIIEIGAVKLNERLEQTDSFCTFVRPSAYPKMNKDVEELTEITTDMIQAGKPFTEAVADFLEWCGEDPVFVTWSDNDIISLEDNMLYHGLEIEDLPRCFDIQLMFDDQMTQEDRDFALSYAMWKMDIKPAPSHDALNDAINTAEVMRHLDMSEGLEEYEV
ncbi:MAG: exonuclease domain-containing protein [Firmicutes bacterium]|nr:exonuclease domain-containing protein [Bacillota bacterium]